MGDDTAVRRLVEIVSAFYTEGRDVQEDLTLSINSEFLRNMQDVLFTKQLIIGLKYGHFFDVSCQRMLISPEMYMKYVFYACLQDADLNLNIFERFISAFAIILRASIETLGRKGVNFCKLVPDVFMVLYEDKLKIEFGKSGGFPRLVKYINNPKYLESKCIKRNISGSLDNAFVHETLDNIREKKEIFSRDEIKLPESFSYVVPEIDSESSTLAGRALKNTKTEFIPLLSEDADLKMNTTNLIQQKIAELVKEKKRTLVTSIDEDSVINFGRCLSLNTDVETSDVTVRPMADNARYENIIKAVISHNHSKSSSHGKLKSFIQAEAEGILGNLQRKIISLIEVLDE